MYLCVLHHIIVCACAGGGEGIITCTYTILMSFNCTSRLDELKVYDYLH